MKYLCLFALFACAVPPEDLSLANAVSLRVEARDGTLLRELGGHAAPAHVEDLPPHVWQAFVRAEDRRFFKHFGVDGYALLRAALHDLRHLRLAQGGSTVTMQLARLVRPHPRTLRGKLSEMLFAWRLERTLSKRQILDQYLTRVPLGADVKGIEAAARLYFDRPARALTPDQARFLARVARRPSQLPEIPTDFVTERLRRAFEAAHFVEAIARTNVSGTIRTTLDLALQRQVETAMREQIASLADRRVTSAAAIVVDNDTGDVLAWAGSPDWFDEEHGGRIDGVRTLRQPGSTLKPFAYAQAFETRGLTAATLLSDIESSFDEYTPHNYDRRVHGPVRARIALASSYNVPAVRVAERLTPPELLRTLHRAGFESLTHDAEYYGLGLVLGDGEVSLFELARAYSALARSGVYLDLRLTDDAPVRRRPLFEPVTAALITDILSDSAARAPAFGLDNALRFPFPVAAKTGTSRAFTDNWTVGYTRERTVAVWVGNMSGQTMQHVSGITGAGPLFHRIMTLAMSGIDTPQPLYETAFDERDVCALSGDLANPRCPSRVHEKFAPGTAPQKTCSMHTKDGIAFGRFADWAAREGLTYGTARRE